VVASQVNANMAYTAYTALNTQRTITFTPSAAGNCSEIMVDLLIAVKTAGQSVTLSLQKNDGGWSTLASKTLTYTQIVGTDAAVMPTSSPTGSAWVSFVFDTGTYPVALTTDADTWRVIIQSTNASASLTNNITSGYNYVVPIATTTTYSAADDIVQKQDITLTIDQSVTATTWVLGVNAGIVWENPPVSSYTLTATTIYMSNNSVFTCGTAAAPIPYAQKATLSITNHFGMPFQWQGGFSGEVSIYGAHSTDYYTTIASTAASGQKKIVTSDNRSATWGNGDTIWIWGAAGFETRTIDSISGTTITITTNLTYAHGADWKVINSTRVASTFGVVNTGKIGNTGGFSSNISPSNIFAVYKLSGIYSTSAGVTSISMLTYYGNYIQLSTNIVPMLVEHVVSDGTSSSLSIFINDISADTYLTGSVYQHIYWNGGSSSTLGFGQNFCTISDVSISPGYPNTFTITGTGITATRCQADCAWGGTSYFAFLVSAKVSSFTLCKTKSGAGGVAMRFDGIGNTFTSCTFDNGCDGVQYGAASVNNLFKSCSFGQEVANTVSINPGSYYISDIYNNCLLDTTPITGNTLSNTVDTSTIKFALYSQTANDNRVFYKYGKSVSTGTSLADTTVHTAGGFALRFEPTSSTYNLEWEFNIPTGNIQNKTMMVGVWCKINSATYYAGTHQLPRLTIDYDDGTAAYVQASQTTNWQFLPLPFTPVTTYGQITVTLSGRTDATTTNAYVYWDDFKTLYPAESPLDTQTFDLWADALPVTPPLATVLSANDVWSAANNVDYGANTMGNQLKGIKNPKLLLGGQIIV
jgi:hypothetical protein